MRPGFGAIHDQQLLPGLAAAAIAVAVAFTISRFFRPSAR